MKNNRITLSDLNKSSEEITMSDIIDFVKGNTNNFNLVLDEVLRATNNNAIITRAKDSKGLSTIQYKGSCIIVGNTYNPYPNKECYVL